VPSPEHGTDMSPAWRRRIAAGLFVATIILAPISVFTFAKDEPITVLLLSWFAISLTCADIWQTTDVRKQQDGEEA
jgi:hypothetical protein